MTVNQFWYEDEYLLNVYLKAYFEKTKYESWLNGYYNYVAQTTATANAWGGDKGKKIEYPTYESIENKMEEIETKTKIKPNGNNDNHYLSQFY